MPQADYSALDRPEILSFVFYPRKDVTAPPSGASDHFVPVEEGVSVACRFCVCSAEVPSLLYFHGNGEVVSDYDHIAPLYNQLGLNLFVADYRGYGASQGQPTLGNTVSDALIVFRAFGDMLDRRNYRRDVFAMGRSLGSMPAIEVTHRQQEKIRGLVIESGFASFGSLLSHMGIAAASLGIEDWELPNLARIRTIVVPTLIIHGEHDRLIPVSEGEALFRGSIARDKKLVIVPGAGHNDIMWTGMETYLRAIREFTSACLPHGQGGI